MNLDEFKERANEYFSACAENGLFPNLSGLTLALGLPAVSSIERLAQRRPEFRTYVSNAITALSFYMEHGMLHDMIKPQVGVFMLKHLQGFDPEEAPGTPAAKFWSDTQRHEVQISGVVKHVPGQDLTPEEAYLFVLQGGKLTPEDFTKIEAQVKPAIDVAEYFECEGEEPE